MCYDCWGYSDDLRRDFRAGKVEIYDFKEEVNYQKRLRKRDRKPRKRYPGCPGNNGGSHVYVYTTEGNYDDLFYRYFGFHKIERSMCCGCRKPKGKTRVTAKYEKKFKSTNTWASPERKIEAYREFRNRWLVQRGYTPEWYGNY